MCIVNRISCSEEVNTVCEYDARYLMLSEGKGTTREQTRNNRTNKCLFLYVKNR